MTRRHRVLARGLAIVALASLVACNGDGSGAPGGDGAAVSQTSAPSEERTTSSVPDTSTSTLAPGRVITVAVSGGRVENGFQRLKVPLGQPIVVRVTSDTADEVHLQGYERKVDVAAGGTAEIAFTPDVAGVFLVELVEDRLKLVELEVR